MMNYLRRKSRKFEAQKRHAQKGWDAGTAPAARTSADRGEALAQTSGYRAQAQINRMRRQLGGGSETVKGNGRKT